MRIILSLLIGVIAIILSLFLNGNIESSLPPFAKILHPISGLWNNGENKESLSNQQVSVAREISANVVYDDRMVPHITAVSLSDALFIQGYLEAKHRLFQLDIITRAAMGRLSEIFGDRTIEADKKQNRQNLERAARTALESWKQDTEGYKLVMDYVDGINAYINQLNYENLPVECKLLNYHPEPWSDYKCALVSLYMANTLGRRNNDVEHTNLYTLLGGDLFNELYPEGYDGGYPIIPPGSMDIKDYTIDQSYDTLAIDAYKKTYYEKSHKNVGSNNWALSKSKSTSGNPIFCNDPHLSLSLPSIWFELQVSTPEINAYGVSIPGLPGIFMGFNDHIAWGETNVGHDVTDFYKIKYTDESHSHYWLDGKPTPIELRIDTIKVKGGVDVYDSIRYTVWGPIIFESADGQHDLSEYWLPTLPQPKSKALTFVNVMGCEDYDCFKKATENFDTPAQNILFAARNGDIGIRITGVLPARHQDDGKFVELGNNSNHGWDAFIPIDHNPQAFNPNQGYLASANQRSTDDSYPYYYLGNFETYRNVSINEKLRSDSTFTIEEMKEMQHDSYSELAAQLLPQLLSKSTISDEHNRILSEWDYQYRKESVAATIFHTWMKALKPLIFDEIESYKDSMNITLPEDHVMVDLIANRCDHRIFDKLYTIEAETCEDIIQMAYDEIKDSESSTMSWGAYKPMSIMHYARIPAFSREGIITDGCTDAINANGSTFGPSWRMVVELDEDGPIAYGVYPGGQSGNPFSTYYDNMIADWKDGRHQMLHFAQKGNQLQENAVSHQLVFQSKNDSK